MTTINIKVEEVEIGEGGTMFVATIDGKNYCGRSMYEAVGRASYIHFYKHGLLKEHDKCNFALS